MRIRFTECTVALAAVDQTDETYRISTRALDSQLVTSIGLWGVFHPPIVLAAANGYRIVSGFLRTAACTRLAAPEIPVRVLDAATPALNCAALAIADNSFQRLLNVVEQARALRLLANAAGDQGQLFKLAESLNLPANPAFSRKLNIVSKLPAPVQKSLATESVALPTALMLADEEVAAAVALTRLFDRLRPSLNKQREIVTFLREVARRDRQSIPDLLARPEVGEILADPQRDRNQMLQDFRRWLTTRRYPSVTRYEEKFNETVKRLGLSPAVNWVPPKHFESPWHGLRLSFKNREQLKAGVQEVASILDHDALNKIFEK
jgi:ParB-like chromosome segregation protein Spo0J